MTELTYEGAIVHFPGMMDEKFTVETPTAAKSFVTFTRKGFYVCAYTPPESKDRLSKTELAPEIEKVVSADLATIDDLIPQLQRFAEQGNGPNHLVYSKREDGFSVYDTMITGRVFPTLLRIKESDTKSLGPAQRFLLPFTEGIKQGEHSLVSVSGSSLQEAVGRARTIYNLSECIRLVQF